MQRVRVLPDSLSRQANHAGRRLAALALAAIAAAAPAAVAFAAGDPSAGSSETGAPGTPETEIDSGPGGATGDPSPSFAFSSPQETSGFACSLDAGPFAPCTSPTTLPKPPDGTHVLRVRAIGPAGDPDPTPASRTFVVDTVAPEVAIDSGPTGPVNDRLPAFEFASGDGSASLACSLTTASPAFSPCPGDGIYEPSAPLVDGGYTFSVRATDAAGNSTTAERAFSVDTEAPELTVTSGPTGGTDHVRPTFAFASPDESATFSCSIDDGEPSFAPCSGERSDQPATPLQDGTYTFRVRATDAAGNSAIALRSFQVGGSDSARRTKSSLERSAPKPVPAWYMTARSVRDLRLQARNDACAFARRQPNRTRVLLMDFGKADQHNGSFGAQLRTGPHFSNHAILRALKAAADRYRSDGKCYSRGSVRITYGNTNNMASGLSRRTVRKTGRHQAMVAKRLLRYQRGHGSGYRFEGVSVAGDIEPQWNKPRVSKSLVDGATRKGRGGLYFNYGAASQCPPETSECANNWSLRNLGQVSYGDVKRPLPELYRPVHVKQWTNVRRRWNNQHRDGHFCFYGATSTPGFPLEPGEGWSRLAASNRCVQGELVNIQEQ
jgi:Bacterial Ig-like domain